MSSPQTKNEAAVFASIAAENGAYGLTNGKGLTDPEEGVVYTERNANDWARDWAAARARAGAVGPPDSIGPFGLLCFGMTTCMLMFVTTTWASPAFIPMVIAYALMYGGLGQLLAGILEIIKGNTFAGTAFSSYGCFWLGFAVIEYISIVDKSYGINIVGGFPGATGPNFTGKSLWFGLWGILTSGFFVVTLRKNGCLQTIFGTLLVTFFLLAGSSYQPLCGQAAGYIGFFCGSSAIYAALAMLYKSELGWILPGMRSCNYI
ncbi:MAG: hypothetical protein WDW38_000080 [Sanguina aurantia]